MTDFVNMSVTCGHQRRVLFPMFSSHFLGKGIFIPLFRLNIVMNLKDSKLCVTGPRNFRYNKSAKGVSIG